MRVETLPLARLTTLGVGGSAEVWTVESKADLRQAVQAPFRILGNGSNLLVSDAGVKERVIRLSGVFTKWDLAGWVGAGTLLPPLVAKAARAGLSGLEPLLGIPATVGGAVCMNAGTHFGAIADILAEVELFERYTFRRVDPRELGFSYRKSQLPKEAIVTGVRFALIPKSPEEALARMAEVNAARKGQPKKKSAGCTFKNPPLDSAGRLIDHAGLRGLKEGQAMISHEHGNFMVNLGGAKAADFMQLIRIVKAQLPLELEWKIWGEVR